MTAPVELYDVTTYPGFIFPGDIANIPYGMQCVEYDPVSGLLFASGYDFVSFSSPNHSHFKVWSVDPSTGLVTLLQTLAYTFNSGVLAEFSDGPIGMFYLAGRLYVNYAGGLETYTVNLTTGLLTKTKFTQTVTASFERLVTGCIMNRSSTSYLVCGTGYSGGNIAIFPIVAGQDHGDPVFNNSIQFGDSWAAKLNDTYFYACSNDGTHLTRYSIDDSGNVTAHESYTTGLSSGTQDTLPKISPAVYNGNVYVGDDPSTGALAFYPITTSDGQLGARVDGAISFANDFDYQLNGVSKGSGSKKQYVPFGNGAFFVIDVASGSNQWLWELLTLPAQFSAYGKFVGSSTYKAIEISQVGDIIPRIWPSKKNNMVYG